MCVWGVCWDWKQNCGCRIYLLLITLSKWHWFYPLNHRICLFTICCKDLWQIYKTWLWRRCSKEKKRRKKNKSLPGQHSLQLFRQGQLTTLRTLASWLMLFRNWRFTSTSMLQTSPHWFLSDSAPIWTSWCPCPLWCLGSMIRHYVTVGRVLSAWKQLKTWTYATTRTGCAFIFF